MDVVPDNTAKMIGLNTKAPHSQKQTHYLKLTILPSVLLIEFISRSQGPGQDIIGADIVDPVAESDVPVGVLKAAGDVGTES